MRASDGTAARESENGAGIVKRGPDNQPSFLSTLDCLQRLGLLCYLHLLLVPPIFRLRTEFPSP